MSQIEQGRHLRLSLQNHLLVVSNPVKVPTVFKTLSGRGQINGFSTSSGARMGKYLRTCVADYGVMVTLTYPHSYPRDGRIFKEHLRRFLQELARQVGRGSGVDYRGVAADFSCFWFLEFQERGAAHFHIFTTHTFDKYWIAKKWFQIVGSEDERHLHAGTRIEKIKSGRRGTCSYASKYAAKSEQKIVPDWVKNAGRFWGVVGLRKTVAADILLKPSIQEDSGVKAHLKSLRKFLKDMIKDGSIRVIGKGTTRCYYVKSDIVLSQLKIGLDMMAMKVGTLDYSAVVDLEPDEGWS